MFFEQSLLAKRGEIGNAFNRAPCNETLIPPTTTALTLITERIPFNSQLDRATYRTEHIETYSFSS